MTTDEVLKELANSGALLEGHFELRSGLHSDRFFQCAHLLARPDAAGRVCGALGERLRAQLAGARVDAVIAPAMGGIIVGHEVARTLGVKSIFAEKEDGRLTVRRFTIAPGERFVVAEDVITRGGRVQETIDLVVAAGGVVVAIGVIVDRSAGAARFDYPLCSLLTLAPVVYEPAACPLCRAGSKPVHPGS